MSLLSSNVVHPVALWRRLSSVFSRTQPPSDRRYLVCEECRLTFYLTPIEVSFRVLNDFPMPKTCRTCSKGETEEARSVANSH